MTEDEVVAAGITGYAREAELHGFVNVEAKIGEGIAPGTLPLRVWRRIAEGLAVQLGPDFVVQLDQHLLARRR